jgi:hypothetical protein
MHEAETKTKTCTIVFTTMDGWIYVRIRQKIDAIINTGDMVFIPLKCRSKSELVCLKSQKKVTIFPSKG